MKGESTMKKEFEKRVLNERIVDTAKYRYVVAECHNSSSQWFEIRRIPLDQLDTTASINGWETVKVIK